MDGLKQTMDKNYVDLDAIFHLSVDEDYDHRMGGISKKAFCNVYLDWIQYCSNRINTVSLIKYS